jgi:tRNA1(Val) A37 N6-methylase TrmN6
MTTSQFSDLTIDITKGLTKEEKKAYGIFISPQSIIASLYSTVVEHLKNDLGSTRRILEPSCGTCELVNFCDSKFTGIEIDGVEYNSKLYDSIKALKFKNNVNLYKEDFIKYKPDKLYDLVIGNPPYFVCKKTDIPSEYTEYIHGRPNIFGLFILHSISLIRAGGIIALIIPKSFLNSIYYSKIRNYIKKTCSIIKIDDYSSLNDFIDTEQSTFGLVIQKNMVAVEPEECKYSMLFNDNFIFTDNSTELREIFEGATTIEKMGLKVRTGQVVWNEVKNELTDNEDDTILIYNTNITKDNKLELKKFKNGQKGQYINRDGRIDPILVVNRGNGNSAYKLNYAVINDCSFLVENHLNEIYSPTDSKTEYLLEIYKKIIRSFENPKTKKFIKLFLGNNGLSKTELETIFPIYEI